MAEENENRSLEDVAKNLADAIQFRELTVNEVYLLLLEFAEEIIEIIRSVRERE